MPQPFNNLVIPSSRRRIETVPPSPLSGPIARQVRWGKDIVALSNLEARLLHALKSRPAPLEARELIAFVWAERRPPKNNNNALNVLIHALRQKMPEAVSNYAPGQFKYVRHDPWVDVRKL